MLRTYVWFHSNRRFKPRQTFSIQNQGLFKMYKRFSEQKIVVRLDLVLMHMWDAVVLKQMNTKNNQLLLQGDMIQNIKHIHRCGRALCCSQLRSFQISEPPQSNTNPFKKLCNNSCKNTSYLFKFEIIHQLCVEVDIFIIFNLSRY